MGCKVGLAGSRLACSSRSIASETEVPRTSDGELIVSVFKDSAASVAQASMAAFDGGPVGASG